MTDEELGLEIRRRGLEGEYLRELLASLGHAPEAGWSGAAIAAIEHATPEERRRAALRTVAAPESKDTP